MKIKEKSFVFINFAGLFIEPLANGFHSINSYLV